MYIFNVLDWRKFFNFTKETSGRQRWDSSVLGGGCFSFIPCLKRLTLKVLLQILNNSFWFNIYSTYEFNFPSLKIDHSFWNHWSFLFNNVFIIHIDAGVQFNLFNSYPCNNISRCLTCISSGANAGNTQKST